MTDKSKNIIDTLMTREDFINGTNKILSKLREINRALKEDHRRYHKNRKELCLCKSRLALKKFDK